MNEKEFRIVVERLDAENEELRKGAEIDADRICYLQREIMDFKETVNYLEGVRDRLNQELAESRRANPNALAKLLFPAHMLKDLLK